MRSAANDNLKTDILCVDFWRAGLKVHCLPVYKQLARLAPNITMKAFHRESFCARGKSVPKIDRIDGLECYDTSYFAYPRDLEKIVRQFDPRIVLILTHSFLFDRAIIKLCRRLGIRTVFLQHGAVSFSLRRPKLKPYLLPAIYLDKAKWYLLYYLPIYFRVTAPEDPLFMFRPSFFRFLLGSLVLNYTFVPPKPTSEVRADHALVYGEFYAERFKHLHGYQDNQVHIVGNLTFDEVIDVAKRGAIGRESWLSARELDPTRKTITYLPQPLVEEGYVGKSEFQDLLATLVDLANKKELNLIIKLHPRNNQGLFSSLIDKLFISVEEKNLTESVCFSDAVIGHYSTALGLAIATYKPLIIWNTFKGISVLSEGLQGLSSVAHVARSLDELEGLLNAISNNDWACDGRLYDEWLRKYSYSNPEEKAIQRIAEFLVTEYESLTENRDEER
jgi:hypothetical protein